MNARIAPLPPASWPGDMYQALHALDPRKRGLPLRPAEDRPPTDGILGSFAHHPQLARAFFEFNGHVLFDTTLTPRQVEIIVLRIAARRACAYLRDHHLFGARAAGLTDADIARIAFGPEATFPDPLEGALVRAVDELVEDGVVAQSTWDSLSVALDRRQLLDVLFTAGCYETVSWFARSLGLDTQAPSEEASG
ncbi:carboxymuconolactone decarboxylase family protein [Streptomyces sp. NBC_00005]|uniref:carboxymuconolactone decarboxylase family protein n=1 Tax=Streptomyces sp. NBC_00005 TaxID=2903609 RepID=UPI003251F6B9